MCRGECFRERRFLQPCFPKAQEWGWASTLSILAKDPLGMEGQPCILSFIHTLSVFPVISPSLPFLSISFRAGPMECVRLQGCSLHKVIWPLGTEGSALHTQTHCGARMAGPMKELACSHPHRSSCQRATRAAPPLPSSRGLCPFIVHLFTVSLKGVSS